MTTDKYPRTMEAIRQLGDTHAERARALGVSERRYYEIIAGDVPVRTLRPWLQDQLVEALRADLGIAQDTIVA